MVWINRSVSSGVHVCVYVYWSVMMRQITIKSCTSYMYGCMLFIVGTAFFYPSLNETCWKIGTVLFVIGSVCFLIGACMDYCLLERTYFEGSMSHIFEHDQLQAAGDPGQYRHSHAFVSCDE